MEAKANIIRKYAEAEPELKVDIICKYCLDGEIDMVITKSISRFARNTLDTLKYVRTLKERNIAVYFEDEKINTLSMDGELLLVVLSSVAQQEVENISNNVKKGLAMKMSRGEIVGFAGALGYDYDPQGNFMCQSVIMIKKNMLKLLICKHSYFLILHFACWTQ